MVTFGITKAIAKLNTAIAIELAIAGNAQVVTNNIRDFQGAELLFPKLLILKPE
jgi:hypothetical protein